MHATVIRYGLHHS